MVARRLVATGRVQGVNFRAALRRAARDRGVTGWVRNTADGGLEAQLEGPPDAVAAVEAWIAEGGPPAARVAGVEGRDVPAEHPEDFEIRG